MEVVEGVARMCWERCMSQEGKRERGRAYLEMDA